MTQDTMNPTRSPLPPIYDTIPETAVKKNFELTGNVAYACSTTEN